MASPVKLWRKFTSWSYTKGFTNHNRSYIWTDKCFSNQIERHILCDPEKNLVNFYYMSRQTLKWRWKLILLKNYWIAVQMTTNKSVYISLQSPKITKMNYKKKKLNKWKNTEENYWKTVPKVHDRAKY